MILSLTATLFKADNTFRIYNLFGTKDGSLSTPWYKVNSKNLSLIYNVTTDPAANTEQEYRHLTTSIIIQMRKLY